MQHRIEKKIIKIERYIDLLRSMQGDCKEKFLNDPIYEGALLHYLYLISDSCIAIAEMVIRYKDLERAESYHEAIDVLGEHGIIPASFAYDFARIASFRNFLAHDYEKVDYLVICEEVMGKLDEIETYIKYIRKAVG